MHPDPASTGDLLPSGPTPWAAERVVPPDLALALIREQFPELAAERVEPFGSGWDNTAYLVDGALLFRFPRRTIAVELIRTEARVLPHLAPRLPLPIPVPEWVGRPTERFPWPFAGYRRLAGRTADVADLGDDDLRASAPVLGRFLAALHATPPAGLALPGDYIGRTDLPARRPLLAERLASLANAGVIDDPAPWLRLFDGDLPAPSSRPIVAHGDLYARHLLVDDAHRPAGVIDWGDVHLGDPGVDLAVMYGFLPPAARGELERAYGPIDARTRRMARLRAAFHAATLAWFAHSVSDASLLRAGLTAMRHVLEE